MAEAVTGFPPSGVAFLAGLSADNTRAYFDVSRGTYANDVVVPLRLVLARLSRLFHWPPEDRRGAAATALTALAVALAAVMLLT